MSTSHAAHEKWWQISEVVFGVPLLLAVVLQFVMPLSLPLAQAGRAMIAVGVLLAITGIMLIILARGEFAKHGERTDPGHPTHHIMTTGVFAISRNPLYLGIVIFLAGVALVVNLPWLLIMLVPSILACHYILIVPEERYLAAKFGEEYRRYAHSVRRWLGRR